MMTTEQAINEQIIKLQPQKKIQSQIPDSH